MSYTIIFTKNAQKDAEILSRARLKLPALKLINILKINPFQNPPPYEKLIGDLSGYYSRRINIKHRLIYQVIEEDKIVKILRMWTHCQQ